MSAIENMNHDDISDGDSPGEQPTRRSVQLSVSGALSRFAYTAQPSNAGINSGDRLEGLKSSRMPVKIDPTKFGNSSDSSGALPLQEVQRKSAAKSESSPAPARPSASKRKVEQVEEEDDSPLPGQRRVRKRAAILSESPPEARDGNPSRTDVVSVDLCDSPAPVAEATRKRLTPHFPNHKSDSKAVQRKVYDSDSEPEFIEKDDAVTKCEALSVRLRAALEGGRKPCTEGEGQHQGTTTSGPPLLQVRKTLRMCSEPYSC
jgi:hypothetical protein